MTAERFLSFNFSNPNKCIPEGPVLSNKLNTLLGIISEQLKLLHKL
jgi:hypothetical protein